MITILIKRRLDMSDLQKIVINADDFGLSMGVSQAIDELMKLHAISDTTVMMLVPNVEYCAIQYPYVIKNHLAGVHLQLPGTIPKQIITSKTINDEERIKKEDVLKLDKELVYNEWDYQISLFIKLFDQIPTHIDTHMGYHRSEEFREIYLQLAKKYGIPVRGGEDPFADYLKKYNVCGTTKFVRGWSGKELPYGTLKEKLSALKKNCDPYKDIIEVTCHPGWVDNTLLERSSLTYGREHDYQEILELCKSGWLEKNGFELISFTSI